MFIKRLYQHSRLLFYLFAAFLAAFLFINYKWGAVASPVYQYGMFSQKSGMQEPRPVFRFVINGEEADMSRWPFPHRDQLMVSVTRFVDHERQNRYVTQALSFLYPTKKYDADAFPGLTSMPVFKKWYKEYLEKISGQEVKSYSVSVQPFIWKAGLKPADSAHIILSYAE